MNTVYHFKQCRGVVTLHCCSVTSFQLLAIFVPCYSRGWNSSEGYRDTQLLSFNNNNVTSLQINGWIACKGKYNVIRKLPNTLFFFKKRKKKSLFLQSGSLATTFSEMSDGSLAPTALTALTLSTYSLSGTTPSSTLHFRSLIGRELIRIHFSVPASHISTLYPIIGLTPFFSGGFQAMQMWFRPASVTCKSWGGEGGPAEMEKNGVIFLSGQYPASKIHILYYSTYLLDLQYERGQLVHWDDHTQLHFLHGPGTVHLCLQWHLSLWNCNLDQPSSQLLPSE